MRPGDPNGVVVVIPVLGRPAAAAPVVASLLESVRVVPCRPLFVCSLGDADEILAVMETAADFLIREEPSGPGDYAKKINLGYRRTIEPWIFTGADDLRFYPGWADRAIAHGEATGVGVVGTRDLGNGLVTAGKHSTHSLVRRSYADECGLADQPGAIYYEGYDHQYCDNELVQTAIARGCFSSCATSIVEHLHPIWRKAEDDATYARGQSGRLADLALYNERKELWS